MKITKARNTKLGDYTHPYKGKPHKITVNHNLNKYFFLIILVHEIAHLTCYLKYTGKVAPHGREWKSEFGNHLNVFVEMNIFPEELNKYLKEYSSDPSAASCSDEKLIKHLKKYDDVSDYVHLDELNENQIFTLKNSGRFIKGKKLRKRFLCTQIGTGRKYLISPVAEVISETMF
ncbi:MAG: SprT-like domain-containing protein [Ignavibacteria bacterium]